jgi:hypothetical protein
MVMSTARQSFMVCMTAIFLLLVSAVAEVRCVDAEIPPAMLATFKVGTVTSVGSTSIGISGVDYRVRADAEILDHKGTPTKLGEVFLRSEARFHLNKDNEVDMMMVRRPQ